MKLKLSLTVVLMMIIFTSLSHAECKSNGPEGGDIFMALITTTTAPPITTTTLIACAISNSAEVNRMMIQKEATMMTEENKIFVPSFLGTYADQNNMNIHEAATDVLVNGVR